ncbi:MAG: hypothetical protein GX201_00775 [Clostridiales bacterium]|nr:hypothetical protein [Clostridiales bacterium]
MNYTFIDNFHKNRYLELIRIARVSGYDLERQSLFYIISGNKDLYSKKNVIYDFYENAILSDCIISGEVDFCSSSKALIRLAYNLYNGYTDNYTNPLSLLYVLDPKNLFLAYQAILIRLQNSASCLVLSCPKNMIMLEDGKLAQ